MDWDKKMLKAAKNLLNGFARKVLDLDDTVKPVSHLNYFEDYLDKFNFNTATNDLELFLSELKRKHLVDEIIVASTRGSMIVSSNGNGISDAVSGAALFNYIQSEMPKSETVLVQSNGWKMMIPFNEKLYIVKASSDLSTIELKVLAKELDSFLVKNN